MLQVCREGPARIARVRSRAGAFSRPHSLTAWGPILLGVGVLLGVAGLGYSEGFVRPSSRFPTSADVCFLAQDMAFLTGMLLLVCYDRHPVSKLRILFDALSVMTAAIAFSWYLLLGPILLHGHGGTIARAITIGYPIADLALLLTLLILRSSFRRPALRPAISMLSIGIVLFLASDSAAVYSRLHGMRDAWPAQLGWAVGVTLVSASAAMAARVLARQDEVSLPTWTDIEPPVLDVDIPSLAGSLMPYALIPAIAGLVIYSLFHDPRSGLAAGVCFAAAALVFSLFLRQVVAVLEHSHLYREVAAYAERVRRLNNELRVAQTELRLKQRALQDNNRVLGMTNAKLQALATSDVMTGLPNHQSMVAALDKEVDRALRYGHPFAVIFIDLDHFKALNDSFGHPVGDAALREFAIVVRQALRGPDVLGRWGGEEFVAILPETEIEEAMGVAERVRAAVARHPFSAVGKAHLTCSCGIASYPDEASDRDGMIAMADRAMYASKRLGRNQVRGAHDPAVLAAWEEGEVGQSDGATLVATVEALAGLVEARDHCTGEHVDAVAALAVRLALELGLDASEAHLVGMAARLHDIGKVAIPDAVLRKPGRLTPDERELMQTHPVVGAAVVARAPALLPLAAMIRGHHESWDGTGYPDGLSREDIPFGARIVAVADAYKAMTGDRPYRRGCAPIVALNELRRCAGTQFDPAVVAVLDRVLSPNPFLAERVILTAEREDNSA